MEGTVKASSEPRRLGQLDSLRGIAAFCVVLHHLVWLWKDEVLFDSTDRTREIAGIIFQPISAGHEAVILFFILSGLVLSIPAIERRPQTYRVFILRRITRIYFPYLAALLLAVIGSSFLFGNVTRSVWFHQFWTAPVPRSLLLQHLVFLGSFNMGVFDPPIWSLVHEMRISLLFPVICGMAIAITPLRLLAASMVVSFAFCLYGSHFHQVYSYLLSSHYVAFFVVGICIYYYSGWVRQRFAGLSHKFKYPLLFLSLFFYLYASQVLQADKSLGRHIDTELLGDWLTCIGAAMIIMFALNSGTIRNILLKKSMLWLGEMSFSLYLTHFIVILALVHLLYGRMNFILLLFLCLLTSVVTARGFFIVIERPSMNLGRKISRKL
jgi:peptidoglycan/LPS O-acetylase OafA/YrhL